jgi:hypothetical protein
MLYLQQVTQSVHGVYECSGIENGETKYVRFEFVLNRKNASFFIYLIFMFIHVFFFFLNRTN